LARTDSENSDSKLMLNFARPVGSNQTFLPSRAMRSALTVLINLLNSVDLFKCSDSIQAIYPPGFYSVFLVLFLKAPQYRITKKYMCVFKIPA